MAEKILNTRIQLKYDSLENWASANTLLKAGEVAIAYLPPKGEGVAPDAIASGVLMKVGPGNFNALPWVSATAADVYAWAKQASLPVENIDVQGEGYVAGNVISSIKFEDGKIKYTTATVATSEGLAQLTGRVTDLESNSATKAELAAAVEAINIGNYYTKAEADEAFATPAEVVAEINKALADVSDSDAITNITTLVEYVNENASDLAALITEVYGAAEMTGDSRIDTAIADSAQAKSDAATAVSTANNASTVASEAKATAESAASVAADAKSVAETAQNSASASATAAAQSAQNAAGSASVAQQYAETAEEYVSDAESARDEAVTAKDAAETAQSKAEAAQDIAEAAQSSAEVAQAEAVAAKEAAVQSATNANNAKTAAETARDEAVAAKNAAVDSNTSATAVANAAAEKADAAKTASDAATEAVAGLHAIATSGNVNDLVQTEGDVLVFNCGSATTVI